MKKGIISKLEETIKNTAIAIVCGASILLIGNAYFVPSNVTTTIHNVTVSNYEGRKFGIIETDLGTFRNEDTSFYGKHNSSELQSVAKKLIGKKVEIRKYGYGGGLEVKGCPKRNILDIKTINK